MSEKQRQYERNRYWNDPEYREKRKAAALEYANRKYKEDPEYRERKLKANHIRKQDPKVKAKVAKRAREWYQQTGKLKYKQQRKEFLSQQQPYSLVDDEKVEHYVYISKKGYKLHRIDGPAVEYYDGRKEYYYQGKLHSYKHEGRLQGSVVDADNTIISYHHLGKMLWRR